VQKELIAKSVDGLAVMEKTDLKGSQQAGNRN